MNRSIKTLIAALTVSAALTGQAEATSVAIVKGDYYTPNLKTQLESNGVIVMEVADYTAASLSGFDAVVHYGNSFTDLTALEAYVTGGGRLVLTPWSGWNFGLTPTLQIFDNGGSVPQFFTGYPGVTVLDAGNPLLKNVVLPAGSGGFDVGRITNIHTVFGVNDVANWADGTDFIGEKAVGAGKVIGINMHVITSDTAYAVIDQPWASQLMLNAVGATNAVPEPTSAVLASLGLLGFAALRRRQKAVAVVA